MGIGHSSRATAPQPGSLPLHLTPVAETPQAQICCRKEALESGRHVSEEEKYVVRPKGNLCVQARPKVYQGKASKTNEYLNISIDPATQNLESIKTAKTEVMIGPKPTFAEVEVEGNFGKSLDRFLEENPSSPDSKQAREELPGPELIPELSEEEIFDLHGRKEEEPNVERQESVSSPHQDLKQEEAFADLGIDPDQGQLQLPVLELQTQIELEGVQQEGEELGGGTGEAGGQALEEEKDVPAGLRTDTKEDENQTPADPTAPYPTSIEGGVGQDSSRQDPPASDLPSMPTLISPDVSPDPHPSYRPETFAVSSD